jgi:hypothetical protein
MEVGGEKGDYACDLCLKIKMANTSSSTIRFFVSPEKIPVSNVWIYFSNSL